MYIVIYELFYKIFVVVLCALKLRRRARSGELSPQSRKFPYVAQGSHTFKVNRSR